jgi:hypothetical protein
VDKAEIRYWQNIEIDSRKEMGVMSDKSIKKKKGKMKEMKTASLEKAAKLVGFTYEDYLKGLKTIRKVW